MSWVLEPDEPTIVAQQKSYLQLVVIIITDVLRTVNLFLSKYLTKRSVFKFFSTTTLCASSENQLTILKKIFSSMSCRYNYTTFFKTITLLCKNIFSISVVL